MPDDNNIAGIPLVSDWRDWRKWWSMRLIVASSLIGSIAVAYQSLPPDHMANLPAWLPQVVSWSALFTNILSGAARVIAQKSPDPEGDIE